MKTLLDLFFIFARIGGFTFGGGYAMLPIIQKEIVEKRHWATESEILDYYAIGQCTPGIIAINTSTFIGYKKKGILGAIFATLGMVTPSLIIITTIAIFFKHFQEYQIVQHALGGIRVVVVALITSTIIKMWKKSVKNWIGILFFIISFILISLTSISPVIIIIIFGMTGNFINLNKRIDEK
ncbi:chromate transporter [Defluviitalea phaphyphila]|uniref:chromate transporter n=1 Tax=Defluviitalea phaphyphila TaxID=1473580 RepID=UPI000730C693|nr:chromate transporter [Defluviitalea phaphyphila]